MLSQLWRLVFVRVKIKFTMKDMVPMLFLIILEYNLLFNFDKLKFTQFNLQFYVMEEGGLNANFNWKFTVNV